MRWEAPARFRVSVMVAALVLTGCNANQGVNLSSRSSPARTTILTIPSATHRTTPGTAAVGAVDGARWPKPPKEDRFPHAPRLDPPALGARQARSHYGSDEGVGLWIDHGTLAALRRERMAGEGWSKVILRLAQATTLREPQGNLGRTGDPPQAGGLSPAAHVKPVSGTCSKIFLVPSPSRLSTSGERQRPVRCTSRLTSSASPKQI
jgi:hypothetical protein